MKLVTQASTIEVITIPDLAEPTTPTRDPFVLMQVGLTADRLLTLLDEALADVSDLVVADLPEDLRPLVRRLGDGLHELLVTCDELEARVTQHERTASRHH